MSVNEPGSRTSPDEVPDPDDRPTAAIPAAGDDVPADGSESRAESPAGDKAAADAVASDKAAHAAASDEAADAAAAGNVAKAATAGKTATKKRRRHSFWIEFPVLLVVALVLALVIKTWVFSVFWIPSGSMQNTLAIGDRVVINKLVYHFRGIARGDIVVFNGDGSWNPVPPPSNANLLVRFLDDVRGIAGASENGDIYIKRVIGLPGDHVVCCNANGDITVNGVALKETSYLYPGNAPSTIKFDITVPQGRLWVMGDHRAISADSRYHMGDPGGGTIPESAVLGRAFVIIWPPSQWDFLNIPATFGQPKLIDSAAAIFPAGALPLALGFAGAVPVTAGEAVLRRRLSQRRRAARKDRSG
ncbi:MAG TPA: signal peptidase I [Trebonia sp.]|jgi:signal peptidase I|nr:signal peptidase I [Trebonia sp.]